MQDKFKTLDKLISDAVKEIKSLEKENNSLKLQSQGLYKEIERLQHGVVETRKLGNWKERITAKLKKLTVKIDRMIEKAENIQK